MGEPDVDARHWQEHGNCALLGRRLLVSSNHCVVDLNLRGRGDERDQKAASLRKCSDITFDPEEQVVLYRLREPGPSYNGESGFKQRSHHDLQNITLNIRGDQRWSWKP